MKASDTYEEAAERLAAATSEAGFRAAASRSYFAAFQHLRDHPAIGFAAAENGADHGDLIRHVIKRGPSSIARLLRRLRTLRNDCDYDLEATVSKALAEEAVEMASEIIFDHCPA